MDSDDKFAEVKNLIWLMSCDHEVDQWSEDCGICRRCKARQFIKELQVEYDKMKDIIAKQALTKG